MITVSDRASSREREMCHACWRWTLPGVFRQIPCSPSNLLHIYQVRTLARNYTKHVITHQARQAHQAVCPLMTPPYRPAILPSQAVHNVWRGVAIIALWTCIESRPSEFYGSIRPQSVTPRVTHYPQTRHRLLRVKADSS